MKVLIWVGSLLAMLSGHREEVKGPAPAGIAVVELFTSQGCSSCPAADELLNKIIDDAQRTHKSIYGLSFHVSYWNRLGWKDPYSSELYTDRQRAYAAFLPASSVYTPQLITNGRYECVGSDKAAVDMNINLCLNAPVAYTITASSTVQKEEALIHYALSDKPGNDIMNVAVIEPVLENFVARGENQGRTLKHFNVVTKFKTRTVRQDETFSVSLPEGHSANTQIILYAQDSKTQVIKAAVRIETGIKNSN